MQTNNTRYFFNANDGKFIQIAGTTELNPFSTSAGWVEIEPEAHEYLIGLYNTNTEKKTPLRERDILTIKIVDWSDDAKEDEPAIDVEVYLNGEFDSKNSMVFSISGKVDKFRAMELARSYTRDFVSFGRLSLL